MSRRILVFGDSHVHAIQAALAARGADAGGIHIEALRRLKSRQTAGAEPAQYASSNSRLGDAVLKLFKRHNPAPSLDTIGDISLDEFLPVAAKLDPEDVLVSAIGGNQHAVFSTIQHPNPFDFVFPDASAPDLAPGSELVPFRALHSYFSSALRRGDGEKIAVLRNSTRARVVHLMAPPPKADNEYIESFHDTQFAKAGISSLGVSSPALRLKFWHLQNQVVSGICRDLGVELLEPPASSRDDEGFLARHCYAGDATHANVAYGELVLQQLERRFGHLAAETHQNGALG